MAVDCMVRIFKALMLESHSPSIFFSKYFILQRQLLRQLLTWFISIPLLKAENKL